MTPLLVGISGPSSAGKSTVVQNIAALIPHCSVVHQDDFYLPDRQIPIDATHNVENWDCAEAIDWPKFKAHLAALRRSDEIAPVKSLEIKSEITLAYGETRQLLARTATLPGLQRRRIVFVDGFMLFHDRSVAELLDVKLLFRAPYALAKARRESRSGYNTTEGFWQDPPGYFDNIVWPGYVASHKHLFENDDPAARLTEESVAAGIRDISNDGTVPLVDLVSWTVDQIAAETENSSVA